MTAEAFQAEVEMHPYIAGRAEMDTDADASALSIGDLYQLVGTADEVKARTMRKE